MAFLTNEKQIKAPTEIITSLSSKEVSKIKQNLLTLDEVAFKHSDQDVEVYLDSIVTKAEINYLPKLHSLKLSDKVIYEFGFSLFSQKIPTYLFFLICLVLTYFSITHNLSLIPMLGLVSCLYMMSELGLWNWIFFTIWLIIGLLVYFSYGRKNSKLGNKVVTE